MRVRIAFGGSEIHFKEAIAKQAAIKYSFSVFGLVGVLFQTKCAISAKVKTRSATISEYKDLFLTYELL